MHLPFIGRKTETDCTAQMQIIIEIFTQTDLEDTNDHNTDKGAGILVMIFNEVFEVVCFSVLFPSVCTSVRNGRKNT